MRTTLKSAMFSFAALVGAAASASAQSAQFDALTHFIAPALPVLRGVVELPDGRLYGLMNGGIGDAGVYQITADGAGGYTSTLVHAFVFGEPQPIDSAGSGTSLRVAVVAGDGRIYYETTGGLARFDPDTNGTSVVSGLRASLLTVGLDGHTLFGALNDPAFANPGHLFSFDLTTNTYLDLTTVPGQVAGVQQMADGTLVAPSWTANGTLGTWLTRIDPATGAQLVSFQIPNATFATPLAAGDDGAFYFATQINTSTSPFTFTFVQRIERLDPGCFCLSTVFDNDTRFESTTGLTNGHIYADVLGVGVKRLTITPGSPVQVDQYTSFQPFGMDVLSNGSLVMYSGFVGNMPVYAFDTAAFNPATDTPALLEQGVAPEGPVSFPTDVSGFAGGQVYAASPSGIFRVDPIAHTHALVSPFSTPMSPSSFVSAPDGRLYASFGDNGGGILSFDPSTNAVEIRHSFSIDPNTGLPGPDGAYPGPLALGRDGWLYGVTQQSNTDPAYLPGSLFKFDPSSGAFVTLYNLQAASDGVNPSTRLVEGADGVWYGGALDITNFCGTTFKFDANTSTFTPLHTFDPNADGCSPAFVAVRPDGALLLTTSGGLVDPSDPNSDFIFETIFTVDPASGALSPLDVFPSSGTVAPMPAITIALDGDGYLATSNPETGSTDLERLNLQTGSLTPLAALQPPYGNLGANPINGPAIGQDGRIYGISSDLYVFAIGILDPLPVAPAAGPFGGTTTLSATVKTLGAPVAGRTIAFTVNGNAVGSAVTNAQGVATLDHVSVSGIAVGSYPSAIGASFAGDAQFPAASGTGSLTVLDVPTPGLVIGDGFIRDADFRYDFAFLVRENGVGRDSGALVLRVRNTDQPRRGQKPPKPCDNTFVSTAYTNVVFSDDPTPRPGRPKKLQIDTVSFAGTGTWNGRGGYRFEALAQDLNEPRHRESFAITVYDSANHVVATVDGDLDGGSVRSLRIHR